MNYKKLLFIFLVLAVIVIFLQVFLLNLVLGIGFKPDDWILLFSYKALGADPLSKIAQVWHERGAYTAYQVYYLGLLENLVGFNYRLFQITSLTFKILATLSLFPLVMIIFKSKKLAFFTTILYAISHATIGSFEFAVKGSDYLAIFWMCIFLTVYALIIRRNSINPIWLILSLFLLILALTFSPIRIYPILVLPVLVELFLLIRNQKLISFRKNIIRLFVLYLPFIFLIIYSPSSILGYVQSPFGIYKKVIEGNWHLVLSPFSGIGFTFITNDLWGRLFGSVSLDSIKEYIFFLLGGPTVIFGILTLTVAFVKSKKPLPFFLSVFSINLILEIAVFFIATYSQSLPKEQALPYDPPGIYSALFGIYILVLGGVIFIEWLKSGKNEKLLLAFWTGPLFLLVFVFGTWALAPFGTNFSSTSYYLVVSAIGSSLLTAAFLASLLNKIVQIKKRVFRIIFLPVVPIFLISIFFMSSMAINARLKDLLLNGRSAEGQVLIQERFKNRIKGLDLSKPALFYFDTSDIEGQGPFYSEGFLIAFPFWMHFEDNKLRDGCFEILYFNEHRQLLPYIMEQNGRRGLFYRSLCVEKGNVSHKDILYEPENFFAFKLKNKDFIDIRDGILKELGF
ncbi:hypothetical protein HYZ05_02985 [Candidatus Daviesbacteria bacterium]|nr:hypothetical protein [Candidatus Daviesbacteria bacterium]